MSWIGQISFCDPVTKINLLIEAVNERADYFRAIPKSFRKLKFRDESTDGYQDIRTPFLLYPLTRYVENDYFERTLWNDGRDSALIPRILTLFRYSAQPESLGTYDKGNFADDSRAAAFLLAHGYGEFVDPSGTDVNFFRALRFRNSGRFWEALYLLVNNIIYPFTTPAVNTEQYVYREKSVGYMDASEILDEFNDTKYDTDYWTTPGIWCGHERSLSQYKGEDSWKATHYNYPCCRLTIQENDFSNAGEVRVWYRAATSMQIFTGAQNSSGLWLYETTQTNYPWGNSNNTTYDYFETYQFVSGQAIITPPFPESDIAAVDTASFPNPANIHAGDIKSRLVSANFWYQMRNWTLEQYPPLSYRFLD